jgi:RNA polymerase sigma factor (sigma-70 family)
MVKNEAASLEAIESVYRTRGADFLRFALARTGDTERAHDAVQEGFARVLRSRETFRGAGSLEAWIGRCVINAAEDENRKASARIVRDEATDAPSAATDAANATVREAALRLPQRQRDALFLRYYLDFDYRTIAETLGIEVGTVSATLHAARAALGHALEEVPQ